VNGARWVQQQILDTYPRAALKVYAVWYAMYPSDARERWRPRLLPDPRVEHWWDERRVVGTRLLKELAPYQARRAPGSKEFREEVLWDAYLLFDARATWGTTMPEPVSWGYTILAAREALARQVAEQMRRQRQ